jgi:tetratricopeptide (TPR) repeat protein
MRKRQGSLALALTVALAGSVQAANFSYKFGEQEVNLGWPHATADWHAHHIPSHQDANFYNMKNRYEVFLGKGKEHLKRGLKRAAVEDLGQAVAIEPYQPYARRLLAHALMGIGDYAGSLEQFRRVKSLSYNAQRLDIEWEDYTQSRAHYINDLEALRAACVREPNNPVPIFLLGIYRYYDDKYSESLAAFQRAQWLRPHDQDVNYYVHAAKRKLK